MSMHLVGMLSAPRASFCASVASLAVPEFNELFLPPHFSKLFVY